MTTGYEKAKADIAAGHATARALWVLLSDEHERDGYALKPSPWEGSGEYQHISYGDGLGVLVRIPFNKPSFRTTKAFAAPAPEGKCPTCGALLPKHES